MEEEFYRLINTYNRIRDVYYSLYQCSDTRSYEYTIIDKVWWDFDISKDVTHDMLIQKVKEFSDYLLKEDLKHCILFSGNKGFHVYVFTDKKPLRNIRDALYTVHNHYQKLLNLGSDPVVWDISRVVRVPNTLSMKSRLYCIPISREDLTYIGHIREKAKTQQWDFPIYGNKLLDITSFDIVRENSTISMPHHDYDINITDATVNTFLPCVKSWLINDKNRLNEEMCNWQSRYYFGIYCRDMAIPIAKADQIAKKFWMDIKTSDGTSTKYGRMKERKSLEYAYKKGDLFPNCDSLYEMGLCLGKCPKYKEKGSPLYH